MLQKEKEATLNALREAQTKLNNEISNVKQLKTLLEGSNKKEAELESYCQQLKDENKVQEIQNSKSTSALKAEVHRLTALLEEQTLEKVRKLSF